MVTALRPATRARDGLWARLDDRGRLVLLCIAAVGVGLIGAGGGTVARAMVGGFGLLVFILIAFSNRDSALTMIIVWLAVLGFVRRALIPFVGWSPQDPLLLVSPAAAVVLWFTARHRAPRMWVISGAAAVLLLVTGAQVVNPHETDPLVGLQGALFYFTPLMWLFVGRTLASEQHDRLLKAVLFANVIVVTHGLYHSFFGLLPFELTWLGVSGPGAAIFLAGFQIRPFSTLVSPQEYAYFLMFALLIAYARLLHPESIKTLWEKRGLVVLVGATLVALFFTGGRGTIVFAVVGIVVTTVARRRSPLVFLVLISVVMAGALFIGQQDVQSYEGDGEAQTQSKASVIITHQLSGLTNPSDSTAPLHYAQAMEGIRRAMENPLGLGTSEASIAEQKVDPGRAPTPENDIGNTSLALGLPGGAALAVLIGAGLVTAVRVYRRNPTARTLAWLGLLVVALGQWLNGALYSVSTILFLSLGGLEREHLDLTDREAAGRSR